MQFWILSSQQKYLLDHFCICVMFYIGLKGLDEEIAQEEKKESREGLDDDLRNIDPETVTTKIKILGDFYSEYVTFQM